MGKGSYPGGHTIIGTDTPDWFGDGDPTDGDVVPGRSPVELPADVELAIASLRKSVLAFENKLRSAERDLESEKRKLASLLEKYGQPLDANLKQGGNG